MVRFVSGAEWLGDKVWAGLKTAGAFSWGIVKAIGKWGWKVLKSAGAWVWNLLAEAPERIWRLLKHINSGIIGTISWLWTGLKGMLGHVLDGLNGTFKWFGKGAAGLFSWIWKGLRGGAKWAWKLLKGDFSGFWDGFGDLFSWLGDGAKSLVKWGKEGLIAVAKWAWDGLKGVGRWLLDGFLAGAAWVGRLIAKLLDLIGFGEIMDLLWQIIKFNSRPLTSAEIAEASKVFGNTISYWQVRVDEHSLIAVLGALFQGTKNMGVTLFHTINFSRKIKPAPGSSDMGWLIHELAHVWQMEHVGMQYIGEAVHAQATTGYVYGVDRDYRNNANGTLLATSRSNGKTLQDFNREQQAAIAEHYYMRLSNSYSTADWQKFISDFQKP